MSNNIVKRSEIEATPGLDKVHFLNPNARRINKSLGDMGGLTAFGFHLIEVLPGHWSTEFHTHHHEDECVYVLAGTAEVRIGDHEYLVEPGDFIAYPKGGEPHTMRNVGATSLICIVVGERADHDVGDFPELGKRLFRNKGMPWSIADIADLEHPEGGAK